MIRTILLVLVYVAVSVSGVQRADAAPIYAATGGSSNSNLYILDSTTGATQTTIGPIGFAVTGLAFDPTSGVLYGTTTRRSPLDPSSLITINITTGAGTLVGSNLIGPIADIAFDAAGTLYGWTEGAGDDLVTINLGTGAAGIVGNFGAFTRGSGLSFDGSGTLWFAGEADSDVFSRLNTINPATGLSTGTLGLAPTTTARFNGMAFDGTTMFSSRNDGTLHTFNLTTGDVMLIGPTVSGIDAIAFAIPEPSTVTLIATAIGVFAWRRRRKIITT